jgi:hypothetical protein
MRARPCWRTPMRGCQAIHRKRTAGPAPNRCSGPDPPHGSPIMPVPGSSVVLPRPCHRPRALAPRGPPPPNDPTTQNDRSRVEATRLDQADRLSPWPVVTRTHRAPAEKMVLAATAATGPAGPPDPLRWRSDPKTPEVNASGVFAFCIGSDAGEVARPGLPVARREDA